MYVTGSEPVAFNWPSQDATLSYAVSVGRDTAETTVAPIVNDDQATYAIQLDGAVDEDGIIPLAVGKKQT